MSVTAEASVRAAVNEAEGRLAAAGVATPRVDAEWLLAGILRIGRSRLGVQLDAPLPADVALAYAAAVRRRAAREPLQRILGWEEFRGLRLRLTADVLVPRPETETLVEWALALLPPPGAARLRVADIGTGSGCIACTLVAERDDVDVTAIDISPAAAAVAAGNARALGFRVGVAVSDLLQALRPASLDALVANPPYIARSETAGLAPEVTLHEPRPALDGGVSGRDVLDRLVDDAPRVLRAGGMIALETGGPAHVEALAARLRQLGFTDVACRVDLTGVVRFVAGRRAR